MIICYTVPEIWDATDVKKTPGDIIISYMRTKNYDQMMYISWDIVCSGQMNRQKDGKSDTERCASPKKFSRGGER